MRFVLALLAVLLLTGCGTDLGGSIGNVPEDEYTPLTSSWTYDLSKYDYDFHSGQYRILKEFGGTVYAAEFSMVDSAPEG